MSLSDSSLEDDQVSTKPSSRSFKKMPSLAKPPLVKKETSS